VRPMGLNVTYSFAVFHIIDSRLSLMGFLEEFVILVELSYAERKQ